MSSKYGEKVIESLIAAETSEKGRNSRNLSQIFYLYIYLSKISIMARVKFTMYMTNINSR